MSGSIKDKGDAFVQLESIMLRQMLQSSGAFRAGSTPGSQLRTDMFVETLADAVAKAGGLGIGRMLERQLGHAGAAGGAGAGMGAGDAPNMPHAFPPVASSLNTFAPTRLSTAAASGIDDLDDPNSDAPLPEDPTATSIDDFQPTKGASLRGNLVTHAGDHQPGLLLMPKADAHARTIFVGRALNSYRERAEETLGGTLVGVSKEKAP